MVRRQGVRGKVDYGWVKNNDTRVLHQIYAGGKASIMKRRRVPERLAHQHPPVSPNPHITTVEAVRHGKANDL